MRTLKKLTVAGLALLVGLSLLTPTQAGTTAGVSCDAGTAMGSLYGPSPVSIGRISGQLVGGAGPAYQCEGLLEPHVAGSSWTGFSPTGTIYGDLLPLAGGQGRVQFWGAYGMTPEGRGSFQAYLTMPSPLLGQPDLLVGSFSGRFWRATQLDPVLLIPIPGSFRGTWSACL